MMAQALYTSFGADGEPPIVAQLCAPEDRARLARALAALARQLAGAPP